MDRSILFALAPLCLLTLRGPAASARGGDNPKPAPRDSRSIRNVRIARPEELRDDPEADAALAEILKRLSRTPPPERTTGRIPYQELEELCGFTSRYLTTKAALRAKCAMAARIACITSAGARPDLRACLEDMASNYRGTPEAVLSQLFLLLSSFEATDPREDLGKARKAMAEFRDSARIGLPFLRMLDGDHTPLGRGFRAYVLGSGEDRFVPQIDLTVACLAARVGEDDQARKLYHNVASKYPATKWARDAKRSLESIELKQKYPEDARLDDSR